MSSNRIAVIDYGMGNLRSVLNALHHVGATGELVTDPEQVARYGKIILPGVGAFMEAMLDLKKDGMDQALGAAKEAGVPILGICLGMQLMCSSSEEDGHHEGLKWVDAAVRRFPEFPGLKVPHIGWNDLVVRRPHFLVGGLTGKPDVYFVHSYRVECADQGDVVASCNYGDEFTAIFAHENVMGIQFHPEKSQVVGLRILKNFAGHGTC